MCMSTYDKRLVSIATVRIDSQVDVITYSLMLYLQFTIIIIIIIIHFYFRVCLWAWSI